MQQASVTTNYSVSLQVGNLATWQLVKMRTFLERRDLGHAVGLHWQILANETPFLTYWPPGAVYREFLIQKYGLSIEDACGVPSPHPITIC